MSIAYPCPHGQDPATLGESHALPARHLVASCILLGHWARGGRQRGGKDGPVCDVCGAEPAQTVALRIGRANWHKDLCQSHMTELLNGARRPTRGARPGSRNRATATGATSKTMTRKTTPRGRKRASMRPGRRGTNRDVAAQIKKLRGNGLSYRQIGDALMKRGIKPQRAKAWNPVVIGRMVKRAA